MLFNSFLIGNEPIPITIFPNLFKDPKIQSSKKKMDQLIDFWKQNTRYKIYFTGTELIQTDIVITHENDNHNFILLTFNHDHTLTKNSKNTIKNSLKPRKALFGDFENELKKISLDLFAYAFERFAKELKLEGDHYLRCDLRGFIVNLMPKNAGSPLTHNLGWHWDYCSHSSMVTELSSDFDPAGILFARNINVPPLPNCRKPASHDDAIPNEETLVAVDHVNNGGLFFTSERGGIVHRPLPPIVPHGKSGLLMRTILQVVLMDHEWFEMSKNND